MFYPLAILILFIAVPLVELGLLIQLGKYVGVLATIAIVIGTAVIGTALLRRQGFAVLSRTIEAVQAGRAPVEPVVEGLFLLIAGAFLLTPGLITDTIGFLLLIPAIRRSVAAFAIKRTLASGMVQVRTYTSSSRRAPDDASFAERPPRETTWRASRQKPGGGGGRSGDGPTIIEGDYERIDEGPESGSDRPRS